MAREPLSEQLTTKAREGWQGASRAARPIIDGLTGSRIGRTSSDTLKAGADRLTKTMPGTHQESKRHLGRNLLLGGIGTAALAGFAKRLYFKGVGGIEDMYRDRTASNIPNFESGITSERQGEPAGTDALSAETSAYPADSEAATVTRASHPVTTTALQTPEMPPAAS